MRRNDGPREGISPALAEMLNTLGPEERKELSELLRQPNTYIAEDMDDLIAILREFRD